MILVKGELIAVSERPPVFRVFRKALAPVKIRLSPDPRLVGAAHIGFHLVDPAEVPLLCDTAEEWADRDILPGIGVPELERDNAAEIFGPEIDTLDRFALLHERNKPAEDIGPALFDPEIHVRDSRCYAGT